MKSRVVCKPLLFTLAALLPAGGGAAPSSMDLLNQASAELDGYREVLTTKSSAQSVAECALGFGENPEIAVSMAEKNVRIKFSERISGSTLGTWALVIKGEEQISNEGKNLNKTLSSRSQDEISAKVLPPIVFDRVSVNQNPTNGGGGYLAGVCGKAGLKDLKYAEFKYFYEEALTRWQRAFSENDRVEIMRLETALEAFIKNTSIFHEFPASVKVYNENLMFPLRKKIAQIQRISAGKPRIVIVGNQERVLQAEGYIKSIFPGAQITASETTTGIKVDQLVFAPFPEIRSLAAGVKENLAGKTTKQDELREMVSEDLKITLAERRNFQYYLRKIKSFFVWRSPSASPSQAMLNRPEVPAQGSSLKSEGVERVSTRATVGQLSEKYVLVKPGDSLLKICLQNKISFTRGLRLNPSLKGDPNRVLVGQKLRIQ